VAQHVADDLHVGAAGQGERGCSVPEVVQPDRWQVGVPDHPVEGPTDEVWVERGPVLAGEYQAGVLPHGRVRGGLGLLVLLVLSQHLDGAGV
jgi:hypothetical protein